MTAEQQEKLAEAIQVLHDLGLPKPQRNERSALCLLALLDLTPDKPWKKASSPLIGITPIMDWARTHYGKHYAPNTRETIRRQTMHQFVQAGIAVRNPHLPELDVNSPRTAYRIEESALALLRSHGSARWSLNLEKYASGRQSLVQSYAKARAMTQISVQIAPGQQIRLSAGKHNLLIRAIVQEFAPRFAPGSDLIYVGDTGKKWGYFDQAKLTALGVELDSHGKMPDVILHDTRRNWLLLVESVTSHGPVDSKRHAELRALFEHSKAGLVYVTAFPSRAVMGRYLGEIAWETEVWVAEAPSHLIHFNGERFLGPYSGD